MPRKSRKNVGLIGLGIIGARVATGLRAAGYQAFVWNRTPKPAPNFLGSPAEVADICEILQIFVSDAQAVFEMIEAFGDSLTPRHIIICNATIGPEATLEAARMVENRGATFLDAPFTGSKGAADRSQLVYYVGGEESVYLRAKPVLEATSKAIVRCGKVGNAATLKVATNLITAVTTQTLAEALAITRKFGISPESFAAAVEHNACRSGVIELKMPKMVTADYEPHFSLKHMFKDVQLGIHLANDLDLELPVTTVTAGVMYGALSNGWADLDFSSVFKIYDGSFPPAPEPAALPAGNQEPEALTDRKPVETDPDEFDEIEIPPRVPEAAPVTGEHDEVLAKAIPLPAEAVVPLGEAISADEPIKKTSDLLETTKSVETSSSAPVDLESPPAPGVKSPSTVVHDVGDEMEFSGDIQDVHDAPVSMETKDDEKDERATNGGLEAAPEEPVARPFNRILRRFFSSNRK